MNGEKEQQLPLYLLYFFSLCIQLFIVLMYVENVEKKHRKLLSCFFLVYGVALPEDTQCTQYRDKNNMEWK